MPITAFNTTEKPVSVKFIISTEGTAYDDSAFGNAGHQRKSRTLCEHCSQTREQIGKATVKVVTEALGEEFESVTGLRSVHYHPM